MNTNPINLGIRFLLEIVMLIVFALWGWHLSITWIRYIAAAGIPLMAAALWGIFRIPDDPKPAPVEIPGVVRLLLELVLFTLAIYDLMHLGYTQLSLVMTLIVLLHYLASYDRTWVMLRNKPYKGFVK